MRALRSAHRAAAALTQSDVFGGSNGTEPIQSDHDGVEKPQQNAIVH